VLKGVIAPRDEPVSLEEMAAAVRDGAAATVIEP